MTDQIGIVLVVAGHLLQELSGAGLRYRTQIVDQLIPRHADSVIDNRQLAIFLVNLNTNPKLGIIAEKIRIRQRFKSQSVGGIRRIGDQLTQKNLFVAVQGMDHQLQELTDLCLKSKGFALVAHDGCLRTRIRTDTIVSAQLFSSPQTALARIIQADWGQRCDGTVTERYNSVTNNRIEVANAIGGCTNASRTAATATARVISEYRALRRKLRSRSLIRPTIP